LRFLEQWRELDAAVERMAQELRGLWDIAPAGPEPQRTSAA
jgi:hypothetical protein